MKAAVDGVLGLIWFVLGYFVLFNVGKRFFTGKYRAEAAAAAVVIAFSLGFNLAHRPLPAEAPAAPATAVVSAAAPLPATSSRAPAVAVAPATGALESARTCASARIVRGEGTGSLDSVQLPDGSAQAWKTTKVVLRGSEGLVLLGWAANPKATAPAAAVCIVVDGKIQPVVRVVAGVARSDVAAALHIATLSATGYQATIPASLFTRGAHRIAVAAVEPDGSAELLRSGADVVRN